MNKLLGYRQFKMANYRVVIFRTHQLSDKLTMEYKHFEEYHSGWTYRLWDGITKSQNAAYTNFRLEFIYD